MKNSETKRFAYFFILNSSFEILHSLSPLCYVTPPLGGRRMSESAPLKKTPLNEIEKELGGKMVDFGGWELPVQYSGILDEHEAVRTNVGVFDVSHMGELTIRGPQALELLQKTTCNDVAKLEDGRAHYNGLLYPN